MENKTENNKKQNETKKQTCKRAVDGYNPDEQSYVSWIHDLVMYYN